MKKLIFAFCSLVFLLALSCKDDDASTPAFVTEIYLKTVKDFIPIDLRDANTVVFVNSTGMEKPLSVHKKEGMQERIIEDKSYTNEFIEVTLLDESDKNYFLSVFVGANYTTLDSYHEFLRCGLFTSANGGLIPTVRIDSDRGSAICDIEDELTLLDRSFKDVYVSTGVDEILNSYSKIYYTINEGIVGFKDRNNELWRLKE